jgi:hypothetical protein
MSASDQLRNSYREWRRLADAEAQAIRQGNWTAVSDCQIALQELQPRINQFNEEARQEWLRQGGREAAEEKEFRRIIAEVIEVERQNQALLQDRAESVQSQFRQLEQTGHTLRQVQRSYSPARPPSWTSFS